MDEAPSRIARWRKRSFSTQSEMGSRFVERILMVIIMLQQRGRELDDPGFDHLVLCEFRARLLKDGAERILFD
jgi:hypothetical protein